MAIRQQLLWNGVNLLGPHDYVFNPSYGPVAFQALRRQPFGLRGELELIGGIGGQTIAIPVRLFRQTYGEVTNARYNLSANKQGTRQKLEVQFNAAVAAMKEKIGVVTFDSVQETSPPRYVLYDGAAERAGWESYVILFFHKLHVDD